jgi:hypothetical protein
MPPKTCLWHSRRLVIDLSRVPKERQLICREVLDQLLSSTHELVSILRFWFLKFFCIKLCLQQFQHILFRLHDSSFA